jgi:Concanavalin A-like lectin/glucanases superfamily/PEP-CTERM motif
MYRAGSFTSVAVLGWLVTLSSFVPEIRGDLVQYWPFDDGVTNAASDSAHNAIADGNVGELIDFDLDNAPNDTPGDWVTTDLPPQLAHSTGALDFDPLTNGYVDGGNLAIVSDDLGGEATVSLWYKARTLSAGGAFGQEEDGDRLFGFGGETSCCSEEFDGAGVVRIDEFGAVQVWPGGTGWRSVTPEVIVEDTWHHIALVWQGDQVTGYVDGVEGLTATSRFDFDTDLESTRTFGIGVRYNTGGNFYGRTPDGTVDDVAVWDEALTEEQLASLFDGSETPLTLAGLGGDVLQAGDADMDCDFDQLDLVAVQVAAKYLTGEAATWGEGDWNGAPGGSVQDKIPPTGNGQFDQLDIIAALGAGQYLQGSYCADGGAAAIAIPEPSTLLLVALGLTSMLVGWRQQA